MQKQLNFKIYLEILVSKPFHNLLPALLKDIIITNAVSFLRKLPILHCPTSSGMCTLKYVKVTYSLLLKKRKKTTI